MVPSPGPLPGLIAGFAAAALAAPAPDGAPGDLALQPEVTRRELEAHVRYLASDELAGRSTGTEGEQSASRYLAEILGRSGVEPAGDEGTFFQGVPLVRTVASAAPELSYVVGAGGGPGEASVARAGLDFDSVSGSAAGEDLRVIRVGSASDVPEDASVRTALFLDGGRAESERWLAESGHPGGKGWGLVIRAGPSSPGRDGAPFRRRESLRLGDGDAVGEAPSLRARGAFLELLRRGEVASVTIRTHVSEERVSARNVVGRIPGAGLEDEPGLAREAVVVSAHYDHLGTAQPDRDPDPGDSDAPDLIFNGADDDASGCAAVLEIAGAIAAGKRPARTVILLLATGEEVGLLGTRFYLDHPAAPLEATVANLNVEMIGRPDALAGGAGKLWLTGYERSDLGPACAAAGLPIVPDGRPEQHFFERSDNIAFVLRGIVGQSFSSYDLHRDYHQVTDEPERLDFDHLEGCARALLGAVRLVVDGRYRPRWTPGHEPKLR